MSPTTPTGPAYRLETERLLVRAWEPGDAAALDEVVALSLASLRPWLPWTRDEPLSRTARIELLRRFRGEFDLGKDFHFGVFERGALRLLGGVGALVRDEGKSREIGYWIRPDAAGRGLATEAAAALVQHAFVVDRVGWVTLHCDVRNAASARVAEKLGFRREGIARQRTPFGPDDPRDLALYALLAADYPHSPAASALVSAWNLAGERLL